jgi:hypothetical protein
MRCFAVVTGLIATLALASVAPVAASSAAGSVAGSAAADGDTALAGGAGLFAQVNRMTCPDRKVLVGIKGMSGSWMNSVRGVCMRFDDIGNRSGLAQTVAHGGPDGTRSFALRCPSSQAVVALKVVSGSYVHSVKLKCSELSASGTAITNGTLDSFTSVGDPGPVTTNLLCGDDRPASGLVVRWGSFVDAIGLQCGLGSSAPTIDHVAPAATGRPDLRVVVKDLPFRTKIGVLVEYRVVLVNVNPAVRAPSGTEVDLTTEYPISFPVISTTFLGNGGCDLHTVFPPPTFVRCTADGNSWSANRQTFATTVSFKPDYQRVASLFGGVADPRHQVDEGTAGEGNNTRTEWMEVVS